jgi:hypothetical protein
MEPFFTVVDLFARNGLHARANSALPDAPVQPDTGRRTRKRRAVAFVRRSIRRPALDLRPAGYRREYLSR